MVTTSKQIFSHPAPFVAGGGTAGEVFEEDHGDPDGRMLDSKSEGAAIA